MRPMRLRTAGTLLASALGIFPTLAFAGPIGGFAQTNLVSNVPGLASVMDPGLQNPWGIAFTPTSPFWISDNGSGLSTLYNGLGVKQGLIEMIPDANGVPGAGTPTGAIFNPNAAAGPNQAFGGDNFIFATEDGIIAGRRAALDPNAEILFNNASTAAVYKGLAVATIGSSTYLYAANFRSGNIDIFGGGPALSSGAFTTPASIPADYAPFNIQALVSGGVTKLYVTYALQDAAKHDDVAGPGHGYVAVFDVNGNFLQLLASAGALNSPWGLAIAPAGFGPLGGDLLVGNFGDGVINAFDLAGAFLGTIADAHGLLVNGGLWGLAFGNGGNLFNPNALYLTVGLNDEEDGLFARINFVPEPPTLALFVGGIASLMWFARRKPA